MNLLNRHHILKQSSLLVLWTLFSLFLENIKPLVAWDGAHHHGVDRNHLYLGILSIWSHIDVKHAFNNGLMALWLLPQIQHRLGFKKGFGLGLILAITLTAGEELWHQWSALTPSCGSSAWLYAHLPFCLFWAYKKREWTSLYFWLPFTYLVVLEDLIWPYWQNNLNSPSNFYHLAGFALGSLILGLVLAATYCLNSSLLRYTR